MALNKFADVALLKVEDKDAPKFSWVLLGSSDALSVGDRVFAIGSPLGLERTVTEGMLSTKTRQLAGELYMQNRAGGTLIVESRQTLIRDETGRPKARLRKTARWSGRQDRCRWPKRSVMSCRS